MGGRKGTKGDGQVGKQCQAQRHDVNTQADHAYGTSISGLTITSTRLALREGSGHGN